MTTDATRKGQTTIPKEVPDSLGLKAGDRADFAGCLIGSHYRRLGCRATATFDARAVKSPGFVAA